MQDPPSPARRSGSGAVWSAGHGRSIRPAFQVFTIPRADSGIGDPHDGQLGLGRHRGHPRAFTRLAIDPDEPDTGPREFDGDMT
jgi:hypothetical protein